MDSGEADSCSPSMAGNTMVGGLLGGDEMGRRMFVKPSIMLHLKHGGDERRGER